MNQNRKEYLRKAVHMSMVLFALLIGRIPPAGISFACLAAFIFNLFVLPRLSARNLERQSDRSRGFALGILSYPAVLFAISLLFFDQQIFLAIAWGLMAFGDGFAGLVGKAFSKQKGVISTTWPWCPDKTIAGTLAFIVLGTTFTFLLICLLPEQVRLQHPSSVWLSVIAITALASAWVETLPGLIDDNLSVPLSASLAASFVFKILTEPVPEPTADLWVWLGIALLLSFLSVIIKKMTPGGAAIGWLLAAALVLGIQGEGLLYLGTFFFLGTMASQWGKREKQKIGLAQEKGGKRGVRHAIANGGVAAMGGLIAFFEPSQMLIAAIAGSFAAATSDTCSSEFGNLYGKRFYDILTLKPITRGLDGGISVQGTFAGMIGSLLIAVLFFCMNLEFWLSICVFIAGMTGNLMDSVLGATLQRKGYMTNDSVNFFMALTGFGTVFLLYQVVL